MQEDDSQLQAQQTMPAQKRNRRPGRSWLRPVLILFLLLALTAGVYWTYEKRSRQVFVSRPDRTTGYRFTFALSRRWKREMDRKESSIPGMLRDDEVDYTLAPPGRFERWLDALFHRPPAATAIYDNGIIVLAIRMKKEANPLLNFLVVRDGVPYIKDDRSYLKTLERPLVISGHRASYTRVRVPGSSGGSHDYAVMVKITGQPLYYMVLGMADDAHDPAMRADFETILETLCVQK